MKNFLYCIIFFIISGIPNYIFAESPIYILNNLENLNQNIHNYSTYYEDKNNNLSIDSIITLYSSGKFSRHTDDVPNFGYSRSAYWYSFKIKNEINNKAIFQLECNYALLDEVVLYTYHKSNIINIQKHGRKYLSKYNKTRGDTFLFTLSIPRDTLYHYFIQVMSKDSIAIPLNLYSPKNYIIKDRKYQTWTGIYYGIIILVILFNTILFFFDKDINYIFYILTLITLHLFFQLGLNGYDLSIITPDSSWMRRESIMFFFSLAILSALLFTKTFLSTKFTLPLLDKLISLSMFFAFVSAILTFFIDYYIGIQIAVIIGQLATFTIWMAGLLGLLKGIRSARFFMIAWSTLLLGGFLYSFKVWGLLPHNFYTVHLWQIGNALMAILLTLALGDRIRIMRITSLAAQREALENEIRLRKTNDALINKLREMDELKSQINEQLENEVKERTVRLNDALDALESMNENLIEANYELAIAQRMSELDLRMAQNVQTNFLQQEVPLSEEWDLSFMFYPMMEVSGDFYDFYSVNKKLVGVSLFDVSGHGVASALITMIAKTIFFRIFTSYYKIDSLRDMLYRANERLIQEIGNIDNYITGILIQFNENSIDYVNAGHSHVLHKSAVGNNISILDYEESIRGPYLGVPLFKTEYDQYSRKIHSGDFLFIYSDCLFESEFKDNSYREEFGIERVKDAFKNAPTESSQKALEYIYNTFKAFIKQTPLRDDLTAIMIRKK